MSGPRCEGWRAWATRLAVAVGLATVVGLVGAAAGIPWRDAAGAGWAAVGGWYVSLSTHALGRALTAVAAAWDGARWLLGPFGWLPSLGVWALAAGVAAALAGPALLVFGAVSVVVANATFSAGALLLRCVRPPAAGDQVQGRPPLNP